MKMLLRFTSPLTLVVVQVAAQRRLVVVVTDGDMGFRVVGLDLFTEIHEPRRVLRVGDLRPD